MSGDGPTAKLTAGSIKGFSCHDERHPTRSLVGCYRYIMMAMRSAHWVGIQRIEARYTERRVQPSSPLVNSRSRGPLPSQADVRWLPA